MKEKKRVLVDFFYLNTALTGIKTYMLEFSKAVEENPQAHIDWIFTHDPAKQSEKTFFRGNVPKWRKLWYHIYYFLWKQVILPLKVRTEKADTLICFDFVAPATPLHCKKLTVVHDAFFWQMPENYNARWREYFIKMIHKGLKGDSIVITTSEYSKKALLQYSGIGNPIEVIYQCPKLLPKSDSDEALKTFGLQSGKYLLHVGSFDKRKLLPVLVEAYAEVLSQGVEDIALVLVGERGLSKALDDYDKVYDLVHEKKLEQRVKLTGFLPDKEVKTLYDHAFAYVFPSSNEGFGIPVIEAMRAGIPVIISDQAALQEIAGDAAVIHQTGNVSDLAAKIRLVVDDPLLKKRLEEKGSERWKFFSREAFMDSFIQILK
ncbi:glycosyltransferase family 4 protein [Mongoliibacter ruber]|uniref:Glycosyltransferase involved in cell wall biosynthesis n=1 Tax=Mongoliibacter ruber TaxID=1750599 RepID=A0A2T0WT75_9BACT|nr:glycosyltransferase family 1 protein [Mongoliibacter ruber]PRY89880.1 glycosyltransferase involved in cell wall biosynthesis [Mongoliibacter ruber]